MLLIRVNDCRASGVLEPVRESGVCGTILQIYSRKLWNM